MSDLPKALSSKIAVQACYKNVLMVKVRSMCAELEQVGQKLGLVDSNNAEAAVLSSQRVPQLCQACCGVAALQNEMLDVE